MSSTLRFAVVFMMLLTAAALGLLALQIVRPARAPMPAQVAPAALQTGYLAAAHALPAGTLARDQDFAVKMAAPAGLPEGAIGDTPEARDGLRGALIRAYVDAGSPILA